MAHPNHDTEPSDDNEEEEVIVESEEMIALALRQLEDGKVSFGPEERLVRTTSHFRVAI